MKRIVASRIRADHPTVNLNVYPRGQLERVIRHFNNYAINSHCGKRGGILNPEDLVNLGEPTHRVWRVFLNEADVLCAEIEPVDTKAGRDLGDRLDRGENVVAHPIMCVPEYVEIIKNRDECPRKPFKIDRIHSIVRVQVELCPTH